MTAPTGASLVARLQQLARERGDNPNLLLNRFGLERFLYRLGISRHADHFFLKGALLFDLWYDSPHRPTRDADLLGYGPDNAGQLVETFREIAAIAVDDAIAFDPDSVRTEAIREANAYGGIRVRLIGHLGRARCSLQIDVGFGDAVTPAARHALLPALLPPLPSPRLKTYPVYTVIAEKYQAMVSLDLFNSRMKDFFDILTIASRSDLDGSTLARAIAATFARRATPLPVTPPVALTSVFVNDSGKQKQWRQFLDRNGLQPVELHAAIAVLYDLLWPASMVARNGTVAQARWHASKRAWQLG